MRILLVPDPARPDRMSLLAGLAVGLRRLEQEVHVLGMGADVVPPGRLAGLTLSALARRAARVDAFAGDAPCVPGLAAYARLARRLPVGRLRLDARGYDFVIAPADFPVTVLPRRGQRSILLAGEIAPLPRQPAERWANAIGPQDELVFPTRNEWHRALAEAPQLVACATRIVAQGDSASGWSEDPVVHFARRVIGFTLSPSRPAPRKPAANPVRVTQDTALVAA